MPAALARLPGPEKGTGVAGPEQKAWEAGAGRPATFHLVLGMCPRDLETKEVKRLAGPPSEGPSDLQPTRPPPPHAPVYKTGKGRVGDE